MCKKLILSVAAVLLFAAGARANDNLLAGGKIDLRSVRDADNTVVEPKLKLDVDALAAKAGTKTADKNDVAVEACCRSYGCHRSCCYSSCYSPCYSSCYSYCPSYSCYSYCPSYSCCYSPSYSCCYTPSYSCCCTPSYSNCYTPSYCCSYPSYSCCYRPSYCCSYSGCCY